MAQYYWEADSADEGFLPTNATVTEPWHSWTTLTVEASTADVDFPYSLQGYAASSGSVRRVAAFSAIDGNSLTQSGVTEIYAVIAASRTYIDHGVMGRISGDDTSETGVGCKFMGGSNDFDTVQYDSGSGSILSADTYDAARPESVRVQYDGSTVRFRRWHYGDAEPGTWDFVETVGVTGAGDWGLHTFGYTYGGHYAELLALGFGNNGDSAPTEAVSGGTTVNAGAKGLTLATYAATVQYDVTVSVSTAALTLSTYSATVSTGVPVSAGVVPLTLTTYPATVAYDITVNAGTKNLSLATYGATVKLDVGVSAGVAALTLATYNPTVEVTSVNVEVAAGLAALSLTTYRASVSGVRPEPSRDTEGVALSLPPPPRQVQDLNSWQWKEWFFALHEEVDRVINKVLVDTNGNVTIGKSALATTATDGFLYIPTCAGAPTGTPTEKTGTVPIVYDSTNEKLYVYNGAWVSVTLA